MCGTACSKRSPEDDHGRGNIAVAYRTICRADNGSRLCPGGVHPTGRRSRNSSHIVTDTLGPPGRFAVHPADIQDRDGAAKLLATIRRLYPWLRHIFADGGYAGDKLRSEFHHIRDGTKALPGVQSQT